MRRTFTNASAWVVRDLHGRTWKVLSDASLTSVPEHLRVDVVSPAFKRRLFA